MKAAAATFPLLAGLLMPLLAPHAVRAAEPEALEFFEKKVRPVLVEHCHGCHSASAKKLKGGLRLDSREAALKGGDTGAALVPGKPAQSRLVSAIGYHNVELRMPPRGKLSEQAIADLTTWVAMGAPWPAETTAAVAGAKPPAFDLAARKAAHWAWQPVRNHAVPSVQDESWPLRTIDRFILAKLEAKGLKPAAGADKRTLLRRLYFDLIGLPPAPDDVQAFLRDDSPGALEKVVDRLLASQHFGERWGRHWLDLVRYAESRGHEFDFTAPNAFQYRDYVIRALNADVPYDRFALEQIAGDLLPSPRLHPSEGFNESMLGTGFWYLGEQVHSPVDLRLDEADRLDNMVDVFSKTFLGLTVACARCHDHKFDAISAKDYYSLLGYVESSSYRQLCFDTWEHNQGVARELWKLRESQRPALQRIVADALRPGVGWTAAYLRAARKIVPANGEAAADDGQIRQVARTQKLEAALLKRWTTELTQAGKDPRHPLHDWVTMKPRSAATETTSPGAAQTLRGAEIIADYRSATPASWLTDGFVFGPRPVQPGMVQFGANATQPIARVYDHWAAEADPLYHHLGEAPGTEAEPGPLGGQRRAGRMIRTPSFTLTTGRLFYLARGTGTGFASINSHVMISGPLHAKLIQPLTTHDEYQWIEHDLTPYQGQRVHVEFTPGKLTAKKQRADADNRGNVADETALPEVSDFGVALVVQAAKPPKPSAEPAATVGQAASLAADRLAEGYQRLFLEALDRLAHDRIVNAADAASQAALANWLVRHQDLFLSTIDVGRLADAAQPYIDRQQEVIDRFRTQTRLAPAILDANGVEERVFIRGSPRTLGPPAPRRFLAALAGPEPMHIPQGSGRLELARAVVDPARNPLVARVAVNRVWHHLFGRGIVASVDNFGVLGEAPSHPELLDALSDEFVRNGWSIKKLIRSLVLSRAYQMSSQSDEAADARDPGNVLLHRMRIRRLEGEAIRDALLTVSGRADLRPFGPAVPIYLTPFQDGRGRPVSGPLDGNGRRSIYLAVRRNFIAPFLLAFDTPTPFSTVGRRTVSNVPAQALILLNDPFVHQQAEIWARRILAQSAEPAERITGMYEEAFARPPSGPELAACLEYLHRQAPQRADDLAAWTDLAHVIFNMKEFIYLN